MEECTIGLSGLRRATGECRGPIGKPLGGILFINILSMEDVCKRRIRRRKIRKD